MKKTIISALCVLLLYSCEKSTDASSVTYATSNGQGGSMARFTLAGNYLYTVDKEALKVFDVSNPSGPVLKKVVPVGFGIETIYPFGDKLFVGSTSSVHIFSLADPASPQQLSEAISPNIIRRCDPVVAKDTVAYATLRANGPCGGTGSILAVYNIKNITAPVQKTAVPVTEPYGLGYSGNTLYVCDKQQGLLIFNITAAYNPVLVTSLRDGSYIDVVPYQNLLVCWVANGIILYDISNPVAPVLLTRIS